MGTTSFAEGSYERVAPKIFNQLDYDTFFLEYDRPNSGDFSPLRHLGKAKNVVLGLVTTKDAQLEDIAELKSRVMEATGIIATAQKTSREEALQRVGVSPQCGFASTSFLTGEGFTEEATWAKMQLLKDLAKDIWGGVGV
jgi:methionine synthase II (cobalamin-independent)